MRLPVSARYLDLLKSTQDILRQCSPTIPIFVCHRRAVSVQFIRQLSVQINRIPKTGSHRRMSSGSDSIHSASDDDDWKKVPVVRAFVHLPSSNFTSSNPMMAVYWNDSSKYNRFKEYPERIKIKAEVEVVCLALKQAAFMMNLPRVRVVTNSKFICKHFGKTSLWWNLDEFMLRNSMSFNLCSVEAEDLYRLLHMIEAKLEYDSSTDEIIKKFYGKPTISKVSEKGSDMFPEKKVAPGTSAFKTKYEKKDAGSKTLGTSSSENLTSLGSKNPLNTVTPVVYTCGVLHSTEEGERKYTKAGYGVYWPHSKELGTGKRYNFYPITLVRCQLQAIIEALQQAVDRNYRSIILRTDCVSFLVHHSRQWLKSNGSYVRYHDQYLRIMDLCKSVKVKFQSANDHAALHEAEILAENGICLPLPSRRLRKHVTIVDDNASDVKTSTARGIKCCA